MLDYVASSTTCSGCASSRTPSSRRDPTTSSAPTRSGTSPRACSARRSSAIEPRYRDRGGRGRVLRAEDRPPHDRRARPVVADGDDPARRADAGAASGCTYMGADNREHTPYVIHRALFGSLERFIGILIEHYAGAISRSGSRRCRCASCRSARRTSTRHGTLARRPPRGRLPRRGRRAERDDRQADPGRRAREDPRHDRLRRPRDGDESLAVRERGGEQSTLSLADLLELDRLATL